MLPLSQRSSPTSDDDNQVKQERIQGYLLLNDTLARYRSEESKVSSTKAAATAHCVLDLFASITQAAAHSISIRVYKKTFSNL